ncbi:hypothetical protein Anas_08633 [Armadillidium nasatum]|nr:hypothetical protein Anas_08633 [Armadillidium nasatum]
MQLLDQ